MVYLYFGISSSKKEQHHLIYSFLSTCSLLFSYLQWLCHPHQHLMSPLPLNITPTPPFSSAAFPQVPSLALHPHSCAFLLHLFVLASTVPKRGWDDSRSSASPVKAIYQAGPFPLAGDNCLQTPCRFIDTSIALNAQTFNLLPGCLTSQLRACTHTHTAWLAELSSASSAWALALAACCGWMETSVTLRWGRHRTEKERKREQQRSLDEINVQSKMYAIMWKIDGGKTPQKRVSEREREWDVGSDSTECRAGSCQSGLLQQECSTGYRMEGGKRAAEVTGGKMMKLYI